MWDGSKIKSATSIYTCSDGTTKLTQVCSGSGSWTPTWDPATPGNCGADADAEKSKNLNEQNV